MSLRPDNSNKQQRVRSASLDRKFDEGKDISSELDLSKTKRLNQEQRRVNVDFPTWMIESLDK